MASKQNQTAIGSSKADAVRRNDLTEWIEIVQPRMGAGWVSFRMMTSWATFAVLFVVAISPMFG